MSSPYKKVAFYTLGCKLNFSETSTIARDFLSAGYSKVEFSDYNADIYIINTCSVTDNADQKAQKIVRKIKRKSPDSCVAIIGCYAQLQTEKISRMPGVDIVLGAHDKFNLPEYIESYHNSKQKIFSETNIKKIDKFIPSYSLDERTRSFVKIQDGCDYNCSFCTIPLARGKSRSSTIRNMFPIIEKISKSDTKEIVLSGINLGDFGINNGESLVDLLEIVESMEGIERCRISSIEPNLLSDDIIKFISESKKILPHLHIPLQSGSDKILQLMRRKYDTELYKTKIEKINSMISNCCIGVDVIVGFPSETEEDFLKTYNFLESLEVSYLHVFSYSERENTKAIFIKNKVSESIKQGRRKTLVSLSDSKRDSFINLNLGRSSNILFESFDEGYVSGLTENYIKVYVPEDERLINQIHPVKLMDYSSNIVLGDIIH
tara:strand:- start:2588 stop:3889 length:1302 start_codon:yes stop_codon:yes gene_type:complete